MLENKNKVSFLPKIYKCSFSILAGILSAALFAAIGFGGVVSSFATITSPLFLLLAGFYCGIIPSFFASVAGVLFLIILVSLNLVMPLFIPLFIIIDVLPSFIIVFGVYKAQNNKNKNLKSGKICSWIALYIAFILAFVSSCAIAGNMKAGIGSDFADQIKALVQAGFNQIINNMVIANPEIASNVARILSLFADKFAAFFLTSIGLIFISRVIILSLTAFYLFQWKKDKKDKIKTNFPEIKLEKWMIVLAVLLLILGFAAQGDIAFIALNVGLFLFVCFALVGFATLYFFAAKSKRKKLYLIGLYGLTIALVFVDFMSLLLMLFGLIESLLGLRFKKQEK